jgi:single-strand DNA-binding protein
MGINKVILVGNVGKDPEVRKIKDDLSVASFSFATTESYKDKSGQKVTNTEWHNIEVWKGLAKVVEQYVKKGSSLYLEGKLKTDSYEKDGQKRYSTKVVVNNLEMLGGKSENSQPEKKESTPSKGVKQGAGDFEETDDLPF